MTAMKTPSPLPIRYVGVLLLAWVVLAGGFAEQGYSVEIDVWLTADGRIVALHDETAKRTAGVDWLVAERTLHELRSLDASPKRDEETGATVDPPGDLIQKCHQAGLDGLDLKYDSELNEEIVRRMHRLGLKLYVWTVNSADDARRLIALGVDGITTDRPGWLRRQLQTAD